MNLSKITDWQFHNNPIMVTVLLHLVAMADDEGNVNISIRKFAEFCGVSYQQARTAINNLLSTQLVTQSVTQKESIINVCNIETYKCKNSITNATDNAPINAQKDKEKFASKEIEKPLKKENISIINNRDIKERKGEPKRFVKPTIEELQEYIAEKGYDIDAEYFWNFYESKGWKVGNQPMKSWKACMVTWVKNDRNGNSNRSNRNLAKAEVNQLAIEDFIRTSQEELRSGKLPF